MVQSNKIAQNKRGSVKVEESQNLNNLLEVLKGAGLDINWLVAVASLATQEVAVKKKLGELGASYGEEDFQQIVRKLIDIMNEQKLDVPEILLSISRSYRHIRAKLMHAPHRTKLTQEEANAIFNNTGALVRTLFRKDIGQPDISKFIDSIDKLSINRTLKDFSDFSVETKKRVFEAIFDKISFLSWIEVEANEALFEFLKNTLKTESDSSVQIELFDTLLCRTLVFEPSFGHEKLLQIIAEFTKLGSIRDYIKGKKYVAQLVAEFELSNSFAVAAINAEIILNLSSLLDNQQIIRVVEASLSNDQILCSWGARSPLKKFLTIHQDKMLKEKLEKLLKALE